jgi:hypothetical protein
VATSPPPTTLYRLVRSEHVSWTDFLSNMANDQPPRGGEVTAQVLWAGLSAFDSEDAARARAKQFRRMGRFIAVLRFPDEAPIAAQKTLGPGHWTILGGPGVLRSYAARIVPV